MPSWRRQSRSVATEAPSSPAGALPVVGGGARRGPASTEVAGWQVRVERHFMEDMGNVCPFVRILYLPVPQTVDNVTDALRFLDLRVAEQVIDVPMMSSSSCPSLAVLLEPRMAEQLVDVPTVLSVAVLQQRTAEQLATIPVPRGRGGHRLQGFSQGQNSTAFGSTLTFLLPVEVFKVYARDRIQQRRLRRSLTFRSAWWRSSRFTPRTGFNSFILSLSWCCG